MFRALWGLSGFRGGLGLYAVSGLIRFRGSWGRVWRFIGFRGLSGLEACWV